MNAESDKPENKSGSRVAISVLLFWIGYGVITLVVGFVTSMAIGAEVWQLIAWGFISSAGLIGLSRFLMRSGKGARAPLQAARWPSGLSRFSFGFLLGVASFGIHLSIVAIFAGPIRFEWVPGAGALVAAIYFARFLSTSCMEELGFRGYALRRLTRRLGLWAAVFLTSVAFGLSHLLYGWDLQTIALGVVPGGLLWGMSAVATRGLAVPIGLHAAWNFAGWSAGARSETGLLQMIVEEEDGSQVQAVGTASYLLIFLGLTVAFWFVHRRHSQRPVPSPASLPPL